ncbi:MAG: TSUP family transporter [Burkholderiaceae bacterium]
MFALAALLVALCGVAIGATSIGGVLVVPSLTAVGGVPVAQAVAAASFGFLFPAVAAFATTRQGSHGGIGLEAGALAGAALGALTLAWLSSGNVRLAVGLLCIVSGIYALLGRASTRAVALPAPALALLGLGVGCVSAWSGTGGPVVLIPLLALLGWPVGSAVDAAQRVQLPVAVAASGVNLFAGRLDWRIGAALGVLLLAGWVAGRAIARRVSTRRLQQAVALALIGAGVAYV